VLSLALLPPMEVLMLGRWRSTWPALAGAHPSEAANFLSGASDGGRNPIDKGFVRTTIDVAARARAATEQERPSAFPAGAGKCSAGPRSAAGRQWALSLIPLT
jgi:hypothetical protein